MLSRRSDHLQGEALEISPGGDRNKYPDAVFSSLLFLTSTEIKRREGVKERKRKEGDKEQHKRRAREGEGRRGDKEPVRSRFSACWNLSLWEAA